MEQVLVLGPIVLKVDSPPPLPINKPPHVEAFKNAQQ